MSFLPEHSIERAVHRLCEALHRECINPSQMEILLPHDAWWRLWTRIEQLHRGVMKFDGRGFPPQQFSYMGIIYRPKPLSDTHRPET
jgi:hypothetical protein